ncbi:hypothetical protein FRC07_010188 [Ceratobasidium sp. 392]|nr:hypothetical protein FRC07_010188 [Ceratobasidium sp. 392]
MPRFYIEMPATPLSRHNSNAIRSARPSLSHIEADAPAKSSSKTKNVADTQNIKPDPNASTGAIKRKRSASDLVGASTLNAKKPRDSGREKSGDKAASRSTKHTDPSPAVQQTKWIPISTAVSYDEIMERMQLSAPTHRYLPRATLKAVLLALLDLVGVDSSPNLRRESQTTMKHVRAAKGDLNIIWDSLAVLRQTSYSKLPNPTALPDDAKYDPDEQSNDEDESTGRMTRHASKLARLSQPTLPPKDNSLNFVLVCGAQFLPILVFLAETTLRSPSVRSDIDVGLRTLASTAHKAHVAKVAEEKERWTKQRRQFVTTLSTLEETKAQEKAAKGGKAPRGDATTLAKIKERKTAETKHRRALRKLTVSYNLELRAYTSRGTFLGSDRSGREFYALASPPKSIDREVRWNNWSTFVVCWGKREGGSKSKWYGFGDPSELRNLAAILGEEPPSSESTAAEATDPLVKSLLNFAEFLEDRMEE